MFQIEKRNLKLIEEGLSKPTRDFEPHCNCHLE
jgi:hypothetical protein